MNGLLLCQLATNQSVVACMPAWLLSAQSHSQHMFGVELRCGVELMCGVDLMSELMQCLCIWPAFPLADV